VEYKHWTGWGFGVVGALLVFFFFGGRLGFGLWGGVLAPRCQQLCFFFARWVVYGNLYLFSLLCFFLSER